MHRKLHDASICKAIECQDLIILGPDAKMFQPNINHEMRPFKFC